MLGIFLDLESTGLDPSVHMAIDLAFKIVDLESGQLKDAYQSLIKHPKEVWERSDPLSMEINGYTWEQVQQGKKNEVISKEIISLFSALKITRRKAVFICQNPAFDRSFFTQIVPVYTQESLNWPYHWLDLASMYWVRLFDLATQKGEPLSETIDLSKNTIAAKYAIASEKRPHKAINGVEHLIRCYRAVLKTAW